MELTASRLLLAAFPVLVVLFVVGPSASDAQRIVSYPSSAGYETRKASGRGEFPRREELLQALDFLEEYERGKENDWSNDLDTNGALDEDDIDLQGNTIYPLDLDLNYEEYNPENTFQDENRVDIPPWLAGLLLQESQKKPSGYLAKDNEDLWDDIEDEEQLEEDEEEAEEEAYMDEMEQAYIEEMLQEEEDEVADIVEEEMENMAIDDILDDIWAEDVLQKDAEDKLKWLLMEDNEKMQREEDEEDSSELEYSYFEEDASLNSEYDGEYDPSFLEGVEDWTGSDSVYGDMLSSSVADYPEESQDEDEEEEEEQVSEAEEIQDDQEETEARGILDGLIEALAREAIQEELEEENAEGGFEDDENQSSSVFDAGMEGQETAEMEQEGEEELEKEVYSELIEFLEDEIDQAINDVAGDILEAVAEEEQEEGNIPDSNEEGDYESTEDAESQDDQQEFMSQESQVESDDGGPCVALEYFIDDCNIVNNYADLGASGYKELFTGPCNRHQLCYACGEYYDIGTGLCDQLFKAEMLAYCEADDTDCKQHAKYFWLVARSNRIPDLESPPICTNPCLLEFLVDV